MSIADTILSVLSHSVFFALPGQYPSAGIYSPAHFTFLMCSIFLLTVSLVLLSLTKNPPRLIRKINQCLTILLWILEGIKIAFNLAIGNVNNPNSYIPLYYCSIVLYAGIMSGFCHGRIQHAGDVFLCTGSIVGGICYFIMPLTSLPNYPALHFISIQSILLHTIMIFMGLALLMTGCVQLHHRDIIPYAAMTLIVCAAALIINLCCGSNLMFISKNFLSTPIEIIYNLCPGILFPIVMCVGQATVPFYIIWFLLPRKYKCECEYFKPDEPEQSLSNHL